MAVPLDWAAFSEADEESKQALLKRAAKIDPSIQVALQSTAKKIRKKSSEHPESSEKKVAKSTCTKKSSSKKAGSCVVAKVEEAEVIGSGAWVGKQLEALGLARFVSRLASTLPLNLLVHVDQAQLDVLLRQSKSEPFPDALEYIKLQCAIRAMHVKVTGSTGSPGLARHIKNSPSDTSTPDTSTLSPTLSLHKDVSTLLQEDVVNWSVADAKIWAQSVPALRRFVDLFESFQMDGYRLLRLNDRKLLMRMKIESDSDRALILQHAADLKALQVTTGFTLHSDLINKIIDGLAHELRQANTVSSSPVTSLIASKRVPNYFLSLRIASLDLRVKVRNIQGEIENLIPELAGSRSVLPPEQLHFTLGRLYLQTEEEIALAKKLLEQCHDQVYRQLYPEESPVAINFCGVMNYGGNTVFLETERGHERDLLIEFGNTVYDIFQAAGLTSKEFRFQPVAPIVRVRQSKKPLMMRLQEVSETILEKYANSSLGRNVFSSLDISAVADQTDDDGYYRNLHSVLLQ